MILQVVYKFMRHCVFYFYVCNVIFEKFLDFQLNKRTIVGFAFCKVVNYQGLGLCYAPQSLDWMDNKSLA